MSLPGAGETDTKLIQFAHFNKRKLDEKQLQSTTLSILSSSLPLDSQLADIDSDLNLINRECKSDNINNGIKEQTTLDNEQILIKHNTDNNKTIDGREITTVDELNHSTVTDSVVIDENRTEPHIINSDDIIVECTSFTNDANGDVDDAIAGGEQRIDENITVVENDETDFIKTTHENVCQTDDKRIGYISDLNSVPEVINFELQTVSQIDQNELIADVSNVLNEILAVATCEAIKQSELATRTIEIRSELSDYLNKKSVEYCENTQLPFDATDTNAFVNKCDQSNALVENGVIDENFIVNVPNDIQSLEDKEVNIFNSKNVDQYKTNSKTNAPSKFIDQLPTTQDIYRQVESCYRAASASPPPVPLVTYQWEDVKRDKIKVNIINIIELVQYFILRNFWSSLFAFISVISGWLPMDLLKSL